MTSSAVAIVGAWAGMPIVAPAWPTVVRPVRMGSSPGDEVGAAGGAACLGVVVGEQHPLGGQLVEIRRPAGHDAPVIGADVEPADVVAHDEDDVRLPAALLGPGGGCFVVRGKQGEHGALADILASSRAFPGWKPSACRPRLAAGAAAWARWEGSNFPAAAT